MYRPNIVLVTVECWRADHFGTLTPHLTDLATGAAIFSEAQAPGGWTKISMTALMSSAYASMHGGPLIALASPCRRSLAECLLEKGYWTGGFTANPSCGGRAGFHRGFGDFHDLIREPVLPPGAPHQWQQWPRLLEMGIPPRDAEKFVNARVLTDRGIRWLDHRIPGEPFFLWLHYQDPHWPSQMWHEPSNPAELSTAWQDVDVFLNRVLPSRGTFDPGTEARFRWKARYRESLHAADREIGRLISALRAREDWDRTIVAVTGDHGEEFFERGTWYHSWNQLHREGINVPLIFRVPGAQKRSLNEPVGLIDIAPTLLSYSGIDLPPAMLGKSLRPLIEGKEFHSRPVFSEMMGHENSTAYKLAIRDGDWKYIYDIEAPQNSGLFLLPEDPEEQTNVRDRYPVVFKRFEERRLAHLTLGLLGQMQRSPLADAGDAVMREQMEALGYLQPEEQ